MYYSIVMLVCDIVLSHSVVSRRRTAVLHRSQHETVRRQLLQIAVSPLLAIVIRSSNMCFSSTCFPLDCLLQLSVGCYGPNPGTKQQKLRGACSGLMPFDKHSSAEYPCDVTVALHSAPIDTNTRLQPQLDWSEGQAIPAEVAIDRVNRTRSLHTDCHNVAVSSASESFSRYTYNAKVAGLIVPLP